MSTSKDVAAGRTTAFESMAAVNNLDTAVNNLDTTVPDTTGIFAEVRLRDSRYRISFRTHSSWYEESKIPVDESLFISKPWEVPIGQLFIDLANLTDFYVPESIKPGNSQSDLIDCDNLLEIVGEIKGWLLAADMDDLLRRFVVLEIERGLALQGIPHVLNIIEEVLSDVEALSKGAREYLSVYVENPAKARDKLKFLFGSASTGSLGEASRLRMMPEYHPVYGVGYYVQIKSIRELLMYELANPEIKPALIKCCENCHRYFIPGRKDAIFCQNESPYVEDLGKACNVIGPQRRMQQKKLRQEMERAFLKYKRLLQRRLVELQDVDTDSAQVEYKTVDTELQQVCAAEEKLYSRIEQGQISKPELSRFIKDKAWRQLDGVDSK